MRFGMAILLILGAVIVGVIGYQIGITQAVSVVAPGATAVPAVAPYLYWHPFFGFGFLGFLFPLLFIFLIFGLVRAAVWGGRGYRGYGHGPWYGGPRTMFDEWHSEAHGEKPRQDTQGGASETGPRR